MLVALFSCKPDELTIEDLIQKLEVSSLTVPADGSSLITVSAYLNPDIDTNKRTVAFTTSAGNYEGGKDGKINKTAEFIDNQLVAVVQLKAPTSPTTVTIKAEMAYTEIRKDYIAEKTVTATLSEPATLQLTADALSVLNNYEGEITLTARVLNANGKPASSGFEVEFSDVFLNDSAVGGRFRPGSTQTSDNNSQVSVNYSPGLVPNQTDIRLRASVKNYPNVKTELLLRVRQAQ